MKKGIVYTPSLWADWAVETCGIADKWARGARILDPGCGSGSLTLAILRKAISSGFRPSPDDLARIHGIDRDGDAIKTFRATAVKEFKLSFPVSSLITGDYLLNSPEIAADFIISNPPWVSFNDLDSEDKTSYKPVFRSSGLIPDPRELLLGGARIDIAALFVATALDRDTAENGEGGFFLPLSLFRGEGAHRAFRRLKLPSGRNFALTQLWKAGGATFPGAGTAWCFARYRADARQFWPVQWSEKDGNGIWRKLSATPAEGDGGPLIPHPTDSPLPAMPEITVPAGSVPRQGVNSGGASDAFLIEELGRRLDGSVEVIGRGGHRGRLPVNLIHPLMSSGCFHPGNESTPPVPERWVFLPYRADGRVLTSEEISVCPDMLQWLNTHRLKLQNRKGSLLGRYCARGIWWALLGVGPYTFAPWKLGWEAYGKKNFNPRIFSSDGTSVWQGNQALHAYIPFSDSAAAEKTLKGLRSPDVENYLRNLGGAGTKIWAQPGRIRRLLRDGNS